MYIVHDVEVVGRDKNSYKRLSHEIETGCRWYEYVDLYLERCIWELYIFIIAQPIYDSNKSLTSIIAKIKGPYASLHDGVLYPAEKISMGFALPFLQLAKYWLTASCKLI
jgi:hypothetical protein